MKTTTDATAKDDNVSATSRQNLKPFKLKSGVYVETDGINHYLQSDIMLSESQLKTLDERGVFETVDFSEDPEEKIPVSLKSGISLARNPKSTIPRSVGVHPAQNRGWAMVRYTLSPSLDSYTRSIISSAINHWERETNVRFYNATGEPTVDPTFGFEYPTSNLLYQMI